MKFDRFEDIVAWQKSGKLVIEIYKAFSICNDFAFLNQIRRATVSIMNNIAEGYERNTNKEFRNFLFIAKGSCGEVRSMLYIARKLDYVDKKQFDILHKKSTEISKMLSGLIKTL